MTPVSNEPDAINGGVRGERQAYVPVSEERLREIAANEDNGMAARLMARELLALRSQSPEPSSSEVRVPKGWKLVPEHMSISPASIKALNFMCGSAEDDAEFMDGTLWVGECGDDAEGKVYGLHVYNSECPEEGSETLVAFEPPTLSPTVSQPGTGEEVERYMAHVEKVALGGYGANLRPHPEGQWVRLSDYQALKAEVEGVEVEISGTVRRVMSGDLKCVTVWDKRTNTFTRFIPAEPAEARLSAVEGALRNIEDMIDNCAGVPRNPDSLPMMVLEYVRQTLTTITGGENER